MMLAAVTAALLAQASYYTPDEAKALFSQANEAYYREDYAAAKESYQKLLAHGFGGPDVLFNLGTANLAQGDLGQAVLYLERARRQGPHSEDIEANLAVARSRQLDQVVGAQAEEPFLLRVVAATSGEVAGWLFLVTWGGGLLLLLVFRFLKPGRRAWAAVAAGFCLVVSVPSGLLVAAHAWVEETVEEAVVQARTLKAHEFPKDSARVSFELHAGLKVRILEESGLYVRIRLPNGLEGWAEREGISRI